MKYPPSFFRDGLPEWKRRKDPILSRLVYRPLSFYASSAFSEMGWGANKVSLASIGVGLASSASFVAGHPVAGSALMNLWLVLDCSDGNIARCVRRELYGDFVDGIAGYLCSSLALVSMGYCAYGRGGAILGRHDQRAMLAGSVAGACEALARLVYQRFLNTGYEQGEKPEKTYNPEEATGINRLRMKVDQAVSVGGIMPAATLAASLAGALDVVVLFYGGYFALMLGGTVAYLSHKTIVANREDQSPVEVDEHGEADAPPCGEGIGRLSTPREEGGRA